MYGSQREVKMGLNAECIFVPNKTLQSIKGAFCFAFLIKILLWEAGVDQSLWFPTAIVSQADLAFFYICIFFFLDKTA